MNESLPIKINEMTLENLNREIKVARGSYLPTLDIEGRRYIDRAGILEESKWDITLNASWNLYSGGNDSSEKRIKTLEYNTFKARFRDFKRDYLLEYKKLKADLQIKLTMIDKLEKAALLSEKNYKQHRIEADQGLVSQLDLLKVLEEYLQAQRQWVQQSFEARKLWFSLRQQVGVQP